MGGGVSNRAATNTIRHKRPNSSATAKLRSPTNSPCHKACGIKDSKQPATTNDGVVVPVTDNNDLQEADEAIKMLNELGLGENISSDELHTYMDQLPQGPEKVDTSTLVNDDAQLTSFYIRHARYCLRYYYKREDDYYHKKLLGKDDFSDKFIREMGYFTSFEKDGTLDWCFYPCYCCHAALNDYQRLVVGEYADWDDYHSYFNSYETELEYLKYCDELSKKLKWMEDYVLNELPSSKWGRICNRGAYQAIKIATNLSKITATLAYSAYFDCLQHMRFYVVYCKDMVGLYYEIWQRVNRQKMSFRDALEEVYNLNKFPSRQDKMKHALENGCSHMENVITEDKALEMIAKAVESRINKAKFYEQYILRKIDIACAIGLISTTNNIAGFYTC
uniref:Uncharacterized protein n=1 Tax=Leersia perrieri TaxID=77586 RepID=A0A0D9VAR3_9ORYZ